MASTLGGAVHEIADGPVGDRRQTREPRVFELGARDRANGSSMTADWLRRLRWGFLHLTGLHRERSRHDYRELWTACTERMSRMVTADEIGRQLAEDTVRACGATSVAVYITGAGETAYRLSANLGNARFHRTIDQAAAAVSWICTIAAPAPFPAELSSSVSMAPVPAAFSVVPIRWRTTLLGFIMVNLQRKGTDSTAEDLQLLATLAAQAGVGMMAIRAERSAQPARIETADRLMVATIHDIKNAVSALSLLAHNASSNFRDPEFQRDAMATISRTVERMRRLLVKLSSPAADTLPLTTEPIDLEELIVEATTPLAADRKVRLVRRLRPVNTVYGDRDALLRVVENLTTNATEAIDHQGTVTVTLAEEHGHAIISVADTGCGISEEYQERHLFSPFRSTKKGGWGVGLYQTKQAVESQDGEILVESMEGHGTTFTVRLPLRADVESTRLESVR